MTLLRFRDCRMDANEIRNGRSGRLPCKVRELVCKAMRESLIAVGCNMHRPPELGRRGERVHHEEARREDERVALHLAHARKHLAHGVQEVDGRAATEDERKLAPCSHRSHLASKRANEAISSAKARGCQVPVRV